MRAFTNFEELVVTDKELGKELLKNLGSGDWQREEIYLHDNLEKLACFELSDGWYASVGIDRDWHGAPNPLDYIDLKALGKALSNSWDNSCYYLTADNKVVESGHGW